jgi:serine/threonine protein kinase/Flp pilus assembly protein TadD
MSESTHFDPGPPTLPRGGDTTKPPAPSGYELFDAIGEGGMGVVYRARDLSLDREVAVKILKPDFAPDSAIGRRFVDEARITGQLQHPGIPPIHQTGTLADGRPFLAMKLIKGQTLNAILDTCTRRKQLKDGDRTLAGTACSDHAPNILAVFDAICQAVSYAHAHGVIHRDLKPANVMVGAFGEVQVMDWGLAKFLGPNPPREITDAIDDPMATELAATRNADTATQAGAVLGTLAFMPPEQAGGEIDKIDERADVFGLGAILCVILTGQPPYAGVSAAAIRRKALRGELADAYARLDTSGGEPALIELAKRCLSPELAKRPRNAGEVANAVSTFLAETEARARRAEIERAQLLTKAAEERKRRRVQLALALSLLSLVTVAGGGLWFVQHQRATAERIRVLRREQARLTVEGSLAQAMNHLRRSRWAEASLLIHQAAQSLDDAESDAIAKQLADAERLLELVRRVDTASIKSNAWLGSNFDHTSAEREYASAFAQAGVASLGEDIAVVASRIQESPIRELLVAAIDDWAWQAINSPHRTWLLNVARAADPHPWRDRFRDPAVWTDDAGLAVLAKDVDVRLHSPHLLVVLGRVLMVRKLDARAAEILSRAYQQHPNDYSINFDLGSALQRAGRDAEAIGYFRAAIAIRPDAVPAYNNLATSLNKSGHADQAMQILRTALTIDPSFSSAYLNLGVIYGNQRRFDDAIATFQKAADISPTFPNAWGALGQALIDRGRFAEAVAALDKAVVLLSPDDTRLRPHFLRLQTLSHQLLALDKKLTAHESHANPKATPADLIEWAWICSHYKRHYAKSARLAAEAFAKDPSCAGDLKAARRYNAACAAALAGCGFGEDASSLKPEDRSRWRQQALEWLRADLTAWTGDPNSDAAEVEKTLQHWLADPDLDAVRNPVKLAEFPEAERANWQRLWADVRKHAGPLKAPLERPANRKQ